MHAVDWLIVFVLNGAVIAYGFYLARGTSTSSQWFLGGRALPWWAIGFSMFATNVDNADLVGVTGSTYLEGLHIITVYALASAVGGILAAFYVVPKIARAGLYTNAEYLEARFGPLTRVLSALIQIQYRSSMLGMMIWSVFLLLTRLVGISPVASWLLIVALVVLSGLYTAWGGLKSVVFTDAAQGFVMIAAALVIFGAVWQHIGGWDELARHLALADAQSQRIAAGARDLGAQANDTDLQTERLAYAETLEKRGPATELTRISSYRGDDGATSPLIVALGWVIIGSGYWTVNHTQTMRLMGAKTLWDMKMAALFGVTLSLPVMLVSALLGVVGRALYPGLAAPDTVYPMLANEFLATGFKGVVVAGVVAAVVSTFDSMGSALSAIFTRDIYARLIVRGRQDAHYVVVGRIATVGVLTLGFLYLPFIILQENMIRAFTTLIPVFVTPLFTVYLAGVFTRVSRSSGMAGLLCGGAFGLIALYGRQAGNLGWPEYEWLPSWLTSRWPALCWSFVITSASMAIATLVSGTCKKEELNAKETGWLQRSREALPELLEHPFADKVPSWLNPNLYAVLLLILSCYIVFWLFW